jgi:SAM-dependent methyltransferase
MYARGEHGFAELVEDSNQVLAVETTSAHYASVQDSGGVRVYEAYVEPWLRNKEARAVLDAGCGLGVGVAAMRRDGFDAVGVDVRSVAWLWHGVGHDPAGFVVGDVGRLPFAAGAFDAAICLGVVEHVGTRTGHLTLAPTWRADRRMFARELERVVRPGGSILLACPNKRFPIDIQHGPNDEQTYAPLRTKIFERSGLNVHQTWGNYHLASYADVRSWYGRGRVRPLPLAEYFGLSAFKRPGAVRHLGWLAQAYVDRLPAVLRSTALNPYLLVEVTV